MPFDKSWSIAKHKNHYDSDEVWQLKEDFMKKHKASIPEDELICLTQTMVNIELLGCRYPVQLKQRVEELGGDILQSYRSRRLSRNKRTFVSASDAAQNYVKRASKREEPPPAKVAKKTPSFTGKFGRMIVSNCQLIDTVQKNKLAMKLDVRKEGSEHIVDVYINSLLAGSGKAETLQLAKKVANEAAVEQLCRIYYTIKQKLPYLADNRVTVKDEEEQPFEAKGKKNEIKESNFGYRLLQSQGWTPGQGLTVQGRVDPVPIQYKRTRSGLGADDKVDEKKKEDYKEMLQEYAARPDFFDLVFDSSLSKEDRVKIHSLSTIFKLKTRSYNCKTDKDQRYLVVSKNVDFLKLGELLVNGDLAEDDCLLQKYELIPPLKDGESLFK